jgi:hypothetical protein
MGIKNDGQEGIGWVLEPCGNRDPTGGNGRKEIDRVDGASDAFSGRFGVGWVLNWPR